MPTTSGLRPGVEQVIDLDRLTETGEVVRVTETHTREHVEEDHAAQTTTTDREVKERVTERVVDLGYSSGEYPPPGAYWSPPRNSRSIEPLPSVGPIVVNGQVGFPEGPRTQLNRNQSGIQETPEQAFEKKLKETPPKMVLSTRWIAGCLGLAALTALLLILGVAMFHSGVSWALVMVLLGGVGTVFFLTRIPHGPLVEATNPTREWLLDQGPRYYRHD